MQMDSQAVQAIADAHQDTPGGLLPALHAVQQALGHVPDAAVPILAQALNLSRAEVQGVLTHYPYFRRDPAGEHVIKMCCAEACQSMGARQLIEHAQQRLGCALDGDSADGRFTLEAAHCLGLCASSPALMLDGALHGRLTAARLDRLLDPLLAPKPDRAA